VGAQKIMELRHLRYFIAVAEELSFSKAAERLHVSQPPISRQIRDLEWELHVQLLYRNRSEVSLTPAGKKLLSRAKKLVSAAESLLEDAHIIFKEHQAEEIHIGCAPLGSVQIIPSILGRFQTASPRYRVFLHDLTHSEMISALKTKKLSVALTRRPAPSEMRGLNFEKISQYPVGIICSKSDPIAQQDKVNPSVISKRTLVVYSANDFPEYHKWLSKIFQLPQKKLVISQECKDTLSVIGCVEGGCGVAIVAQFVTAIIGDRVKFIPFSPAVHFLEVGLLCRNGGPDENIKKFITAALVNKNPI
jgi:DNA-binding transcriptional LysR family regulator